MPFAWQVWFIKSHIQDLLAEQEQGRTSPPQEELTEATS